MERSVPEISCDQQRAGAAPTRPVSPRHRGHRCSDDAGLALRPPALIDLGHRPNGAKRMPIVCVIRVPPSLGVFASPSGGQKPTPRGKRLSARQNRTAYATLGCSSVVTVFCATLAGPETVPI